MPDIIIDSIETARLADFWLHTKLRTEELYAAVELYENSYVEELIHKLMDSVESVRPLIEHLEALQMRRRHDD